MKWNLIYLDEVSSTNDEAALLPQGSCVVAKKQTNGRGKCARKWVSETGNLFFSVVLKNYEYKTPLLSFVVAVSVAESLSEFSVQLKWPNDVLLNYKKIAGILLENRDDKVVVGVGINTLKKPQGLFLYPTDGLNGALHNAEVLKRFLERLESNLCLFENEGYAPIREKWLSFACNKGKIIKVKMPNEEIIGRFLDLTGEGLLKIETDDLSCRYISAGDVFLLNEGIKNE